MKRNLGNIKTKTPNISSAFTTFWCSFQLKLSFNSSYLSIYTLNDAPQPHVVVAFGLFTKKRAPSRPSV